MKEKILRIIQEHVERANICLQQSEEGYEDGGKEAVARYHYWDGAHDMAREIERAIKNNL